MANIRLWMVLLGGLILLGFLSIFTVHERQRAVQFQLGKITRSDYTPGLYFKIPFVQNITFFDARIQTLDADPELYLTSEKKNVVVDSFVKWRISEPARFYTATGGSIETAKARLSQFVRKVLKDEFGKRTIHQVIAGERDDIMRKLSGKKLADNGTTTEPAAKKEDDSRGAEAQRSLAENAAELGIEIVDVRIKRIDLPEEVSNSVYQRMQAERQRVAQDYRSRGHEVAKRIRAEAERKREIILAEAERDAQQLRGEGDATATEIYAKAYKQDPEFYAFYRSLDAYRGSFRNKGDILLLDTSNEFFRYFKDPVGKQ